MIMLNADELIPAAHPIRKIRRVVDEVLAGLNEELTRTNRYQDNRSVSRLASQTGTQSNLTVPVTPNTPGTPITTKHIHPVGIRVRRLPNGLSAPCSPRFPLGRGVVRTGVASNHGSVNR